jgi:hypothetical protein
MTYAARIARLEGHHARAAGLPRRLPGLWRPGPGGDALAR